MNIELIKSHRQLKDSTIKSYEAKAKKIAEFLEVNILIPKVVKKRESDLLTWLSTQSHHDLLKIIKEFTKDLINS